MGRLPAMRIYSKGYKYNSDSKMTFSKGNLNLLLIWGALSLDNWNGWGGALVLLRNCTNKRIWCKDSQKATDLISNS